MPVFFIVLTQIPLKFDTDLLSSDILLLRQYML